MLSKCYDLTEVDRRTYISGQSAVTLTRLYMKYTELTHCDSDATYNKRKHLKRTTIHVHTLLLLHMFEVFIDILI